MARLGLPLASYLANPLVFFFFFYTPTPHQQQFDMAGFYACVAKTISRTETSMRIFSNREWLRTAAACLSLFMHDTRPSSWLIGRRSSPSIACHHAFACKG